MTPNLNLKNEGKLMCKNVAKRVSNERKFVKRSKVREIMEPTRGRWVQELIAEDARSRDQNKGHWQVGIQELRTLS